MYYVIIRGPLGCGKSTLSEKLSKSIHAKHISIDRVLDTFKKTWEKGYVSQASFRKANRIIVLDKGKIAEMGSHHDLMKKKGIYCNLYSLQRGTDLMDK